ncbi:hypothetical protein IB394_005210 [Escherichia coli]|nr:hypothetical protein [Escherichia coli]EFI5594856.1 hypothetical protein [Escherichia coli]EFI6096244.1 hypothetical protein [Escherichia coli]EFI8984900.1 hypothetical protein [Escherichia coli]EFI9569101.1 hypothetical protein [Escherichia coli]
MKRYISTPYLLRAAVAGMAGLAGFLLPPSALAATIAQVRGNYAIITIPVTLINIQATCDLTFTGLQGGQGNYSYPLGSLNPEKQRQHPPFKAAISCRNVQGNEGVHTALTASVRQGTLTADSRIRMLVDGQVSDAGPELWLEGADGKPVPLNGTVFCQGNRLDRNECTLTPFTRVPSNAPNGQVSATVVFDVTYV